MKRPDLFLGLMSGTSMDGIDAAVVRLGDRRCDILASLCFPYPQDVHQILLSCRQDPDFCTLEKLGQLDTAVGECFAAAAKAVLEAGQIRPDEVAVIGSHGQTLRHRPDAAFPFTIQVGDPNIIASRTGILVVADFRRRDMADGGQGAPLAPAFHRWLFADDRYGGAVLNIGGIANITVLPAHGDAVTGFDIGPGNTLLDAWIKKHRNLDFDEFGKWAQLGSSSEKLLDLLLQDSYFAAPPPKSTGFERFNLAWLEPQLAAAELELSCEDVQATLSELTARTIADAIRKYASNTSEIFVCGGGAHNRDLISRLQLQLPGTGIQSTAAKGLDPDWVEAAAFAWLARCRIDGIPGNLPSVTGATKPALLGSVFAAAL